MGSRVRRRRSRSGDRELQVGPRRVQVAAGTSHGSPGWAQRLFEIWIRQSGTQEYQARRGLRRRQAQVQDAERQRRVVSRVVMGVRQCTAVAVELKGCQRVVVMMPLARLVHQGVLDLQ